MPSPYITFAPPAREIPIGRAVFIALRKGERQLARRDSPCRTGCPRRPAAFHTGDEHAQQRVRIVNKFPNVHRPAHVQYHNRFLSGPLGLFQGFLQHLFHLPRLYSAMRGQKPSWPITPTVTTTASVSSVISPNRTRPSPAIVRLQS